MFTFIYREATRLCRVWDACPPRDLDVLKEVQFPATTHGRYFSFMNTSRAGRRMTPPSFLVMGRVMLSHLKHRAPLIRHECDEMGSRRVPNGCHVDRPYRPLAGHTVSPGLCWRCVKTQRAFWLFTYPHKGCPVPKLCIRNAKLRFSIAYRNRCRVSSFRVLVNVYRFQ